MQTVDVVVRCLGGDVHKHNGVVGHHVWFTEGFLHIKEGKKTTSYGAHTIFLVEQETHESS